MDREMIEGSAISRIAGVRSRCQRVHLDARRVGTHDVALFKLTAGGREGRRRRVRPQALLLWGWGALLRGSVVSETEGLLY